MGLTMTARRSGLARAVRRDALLRTLAVAVFAIAAFVLIGLGHRAIATGMPASALAWAEDRFYAMTASAGLVLHRVEIIGNNQTARDEVLAALDAEIGTPILAIDLAAAQAHLSAEGWIARVAIERRLPDALNVTIEERIPAALWQQDGKFALIDRAGTVITRSANTLGQFLDLPQLVGPDAPKHAENLLDALDAAPELRGKLNAAARVGGRRWSLYFTGGLEVRLPEENIGGAIERLASMERTGALFARDLRVVDLRVADRIVVRTPPRTIVSPPQVAKRP